MIRIRSFLNHDPPAITKVINECCLLEAKVSTNLLEFAVFAKTYFNRKRFFVATIADEIMGFVHLGSEMTDDLEAGTLTISNYLVKDSNQDIARALLNHTVEFAKQQGFERLRIGTGPDQAEYYNGISSHFLNVGVPDRHPIFPVLSQLGFETVANWHCLQFDAHTQQAPFSREQMSLRRTHLLKQTVDPTFGDLTLNAIYSHLATSRLDLTDRRTDNIDASLTYACLAQSYPNWPGGGVDIIGYEPGNDFNASHFEFLLCEILRQLPQIGLSSLRLHIDGRDDSRLDVAEQIGFRKTITSSHVELTF